MEEILIWRKQPSQLVNLGVFIQFIIILTLWLLVPYKIDHFVLIKPIQVFHIFFLIFIISLIYVLVSIFSISSIRYELTDERLIFYSGVLTQKQEEIELYRVNDYKVISPLYMRTFGMGNITIFSTDQTTPRLNLIGIKDVYKIKDSIRTNVENIKIKKKILFVKS